MASMTGATRALMLSNAAPATSRARGRRSANAVMNRSMMGRRVLPMVSLMSPNAALMRAAGVATASAEPPNSRLSSARMSF